MFRASVCPSSGVYQLKYQPLVYRRNVVVAVLLAVVGPANEILKFFHENKNNGHRIFRPQRHTRTDFQVT
jgi:hypothetical protein